MKDKIIRTICFLGLGAFGGWLAFLVWHEMPQMMVIIALVFISLMGWLAGRRGWVR